MSVRLEWDGKPTEVERVTLPFQTVETINESRATRERDEGALFRGAGARDDSWRNLLIWGDNKLVMSSLLKEFAGEIKLIYIDPPFATGDDFTVQIEVGDADLVKAPSILEEHAYRDTWGRGIDGYLTMFFERLTLMRELLAEDGCIYVHCDWRLHAFVRLLLDSIFGPERFVNEIAWCYRDIGSRATPYFKRKHDTLLVYANSPRWTHNIQKGGIAESTRKRYEPYFDENRQITYRALKASNPGVFAKLKGIPEDLDEVWLDDSEGAQLPDWWTDISPLKTGFDESIGYPTQKPVALLERIVKASSDEGDLIADFFAGSGTAATAAERLGRRWIACDLGRFAIHTTRKRLLNIPDCRPFEIQNLGSYERQRWRQESGNGALRGYLDTILAFYRAEPVDGFQNLHGRKAGRMVHVGATDAPVTIDEAEEVMDELADNGIESCDVLGWEWEMGLHDTIGERARRRGLDVRTLQIPREVMERTVQEADAVRFFELAFVDLDVRRQGHEAKVVLKDFAIPSEDLIPPQVREQITRWSDLIDYWSVDFDHGDGVFHNEWQAYRTKADPVLATESDWHEYPAAGTYAIVVKIIDIFGNDTTKLAEVTIK